MQHQGARQRPCVLQASCSLAVNVPSGKWPKFLRIGRSAAQVLLNSDAAGAQNLRAV